MSYKIIILAPSCGGKSSLMRYLREHTDLHIVETDEEVMKANNDVWPVFEGFVYEDYDMFRGIRW